MLICVYLWLSLCTQNNAKIVPDELEMSPTAPPGRTYRHLDETPLYSFGFGLSYGRFSYTEMRVAPPVLSIGNDAKLVSVCARVTNAADALASEEVIQVYVSPSLDVAAASPPKSMLVGFKRSDVFLPGESSIVCVTIELADLRLMIKGGSDASGFKVLPGTYTVSIGGGPPGKLALFATTVSEPATATLVLVQ